MLNAATGDPSVSSVTQKACDRKVTMEWTNF